MEDLLTGFLHLLQSEQNRFCEIKLKLHGGEVVVQLKVKFEQTVAENIITSQGSDKINKEIWEKKLKTPGFVSSDISPSACIVDSAGFTHIASKHAELDFNEIAGTETFTESFLVSTETVPQQESSSHHAIIGTMSHFGKCFRERQGWKSIGSLRTEPPKNPGGSSVVFRDCYFFFYCFPV